MGRGASKASGGGGRFVVIKDAKSFFNSQDESDKFFEGNLDNLTDKEKGALSWYTTGAYQTFNASLRNDGNNHPNRTKSMDSAIAKSELKEPIKVFRASSPELLGLSSSASADEVFAKAQSLVGANVHDKAYVSGSTTHYPSFGGNVHYEITVPSGKGRGQYIRQISNIKSESEFLMKRNSDFRITGVKRFHGNVTIEMQML